MEMGPTSITDITKPYPAKEPVPETTSQEVCHGFKCVNTFVESYKIFKIKLHYLLLIQKFHIHYQVHAVYYVKFK